MENITVISFGSWGTALACLLNDNGHNVTIWGRSEDQIEEALKTSENKKYLPNIKIPKEIKITNSIKDACYNTEIFLTTTPSSGLRTIMHSFSNYIKKNSLIINAAKGLEDKSLLRLSEVIEDVLPNCKVAILSGPGHAEEVAKKLPTTYAVSSKYKGIGEKVQDIFMNSYFRVYTNPDVIGMEIGGALKNVIALSAGISDGMGYGDNAKAALMTRGINEIARLGIAMGANEFTFAGLSGIGDLIVTCTSIHSRNRKAGILLGQGKSLNETLEEINMVVEGVNTAKVGYELSNKYNVEMPIVNEINKTLFHGMSPKDAVNNLMTREKTDEYGYFRRIKLF